MQYEVFVRAHTSAGEGAPSPRVHVEVSARGKYYAGVFEFHHVVTWNWCAYKKFKNLTTYIKEVGKSASISLSLSLIQKTEFYPVMKCL